MEKESFSDNPNKIDTFNTLLNKAFNPAKKL